MTACETRPASVLLRPALPSPADEASRDGSGREKRRTHPHLGSLDLPLVAVALPPAPLGLEVVQDTGQRHLRLAGRPSILAGGGQRKRPRLLLLLMEGLLLLLLGVAALLLLLVSLGLHHVQSEARRRTMGTRPMERGAKETAGREGRGGCRAGAGRGR